MSETEKIDLGEDLQTLAHKMLQDAAVEGVSLTNRLEVFKILSQHYVNLRKVKGKKDDGDDDESMTMGSLRNQINGDQPK